VAYFGRSNRILVEQSLNSGSLKDSQIAECDLSNMLVRNVIWDHTDIQNLHANDIEFQNDQVKGSTFFRSSFMRAKFLSSNMSDMTMDSLTMIKSGWLECIIEGVNLRNNCLQRANFHRCRVISSVMSDFEALNALIDNCIFAHCVFSITYGSGMNGFCDANIRNCIFYHCRFEGFPLRGATLKSNVFAHCFGEIGDDMSCDNVAGIGLKGRPVHMPVKAPGEAGDLLSRLVAP
jgi:uncharacterized protein YjbI with pentapeptide repeats